ncbi:hypothetical protein [Pseudofrankia inefficax]|uniref:Uncharacterized protein n=1 Tax=Pseudofrankia inefficax (strain DSM 45817 / CECT 9037 / DDB 130130 / EuI1c) TaxID=298654 RepID=E3J6R6_PSEI1|nr:hypothetical protein [Pseudofrankia inefficax]ADP81990.1 hypothetical protein FraEuI1c_3984 [Pseudofrankia inefficax]
MRTVSAPTRQGGAGSRRGSLGAFALAGALLALALSASLPARAAVSITAPATASLGSRPTGGGTLSVQLGTVTVTNNALIGSWTATVSSTNCTTGGATANETISNAALSYWSGPATATTGSIALSTPGQATAAQAQSLSTSRTAFSATTISLGVGTLSWAPTLSVTVPAAAVAGAYTCTLTHSVA